MNLSQLAIQKALKNEWLEAAQLNEQILCEDPQNIDALNRLTQACLQLGKLSSAKKAAQAVAKVDPYNPIAKRNLEKIKFLQQNTNALPQTSQINHFNFIEEPGKTKVVSLVRIGERNVISNLNSCVELEIVVRSKTISFYHQKKYIGRLPDDIAHRLIWLHERDNKYQAFVKSVEKNRITVFLKEVKCSVKNKNYTSFVAADLNHQP